MVTRRMAPLSLWALVVVVTACGGSDDPTSDPESTVTIVESSTATAPPEVATTGAGAPPTPGDPVVTDLDCDADDTTGCGVQRFPDVIDATAEFDGETWTISATLSSPYDTPERYADAWRVVGPDGTVYGERILSHDHANEQPFTRSESGIVIPDDVDEVTIEGRDQRYGYGGATSTLTLPR